MARVFQMKLLLHAHTMDYEPGAAVGNSTRTKNYLLKESQASSFSRFKFECIVYMYTVACFWRGRSGTDCVCIRSTQEFLKLLKPWKKHERVLDTSFNFNIMNNISISQICEVLIWVSSMCHASTRWWYENKFQYRIWQTGSDRWCLSWLMRWSLCW